MENLNAEKSVTKGTGLPNIPPEKILSVSALTRKIRAILTDTPEFQNIWLKGEVSNLVKHSSGHWYFSLKDEDSQIACVMFSSSNSKVSFVPEDGVKVLLNCSLEVYERRGNYQVIVKEMYKDGLGSLYQKFLELKAKLKSEGLFEQNLKKPIPRHPKVIGVVTSPTGAAVRDIIRTIRRRYPIAKVLLAPAIVQGGQGGTSIVHAISLLNQILGVDVIIVGRGGGSIEDLWCFNEEYVARAIVASSVPIITGIGHETDETIADYVADLRASTPTAAAEHAVPDMADIKYIIGNCAARLKIFMLNRVDNYKSRLHLLTSRKIFQRPLDTVQQHMLRVDELTNRVQINVRNRIAYEKKSLSGIIEKLGALDPKSILGRGYSIVLSGGKVISGVDDVLEGDLVDIIVRNGKILAQVRDYERFENGG